MDLLVLDKDYVTVEIIDSYNSLIWTERYNEAGDFELEGPVTATLLNVALLVLNSEDDYFLFSSDSDVLMVIESVNIKTDVEAGNTIMFAGPSSEGLLGRRIVMGTFVPGVYFNDTIGTLLRDNFNSPEDTNRQTTPITHVTYDGITEYPYYKEWTGDQVLKIVSEMHQNVELGFKMMPNLDGVGWTFETYAGVDRSYAQQNTSWVCFSPGFANLIDSEFLRSTKQYKNVLFCLGGEHTITETSGDTTTETVIQPEVLITEKGISTPTGWRRREEFYDAGSVSWEKEDSEEDVTVEEYIQRMTDAGITELQTMTHTTAFDGEVDTSQQFQYGRDFGLGDIVEVENEYGISGRCRVTEICRSIERGNDKLIPTFVAV